MIVPKRYPHFLGRISSWQGGVKLWIPGFFGSLPVPPDLSVTVIDYYDSVRSLDSATVFALCDEPQRGHFTTSTGH
jgi:hypothetical protein